jgi:hypothetical protein
MRLDEVRAGMVLQRPVLDAKGNVLLREGLPLTERHLRLLQAHGIVQLEVRAQSNETQEDEGMSTEQAAALVDSQFINNDRDHPLIAELMRLCRQRRTLGTGGG